MKIGKWEAETKRRDPQGGSSLDGTTFAIVNKSNYSVLYEPGATIATIKTDKDGYWESEEKWLPYGSYAAIEAKAPENHILTGTVKNLEIRNDGEVIDLDQGQFENQVFRGDLEFVKAGQGNKERLARMTLLSSKVKCIKELDTLMMIPAFPAAVELIECKTKYHIKVSGIW